MSYNERDLEGAAALLTAFDSLTGGSSLSVEAHGLADRLWPEGQRNREFAWAVREWTTLLRSRISARGESPVS